MRAGVGQIVKTFIQPVNLGRQKAISTYYISEQINNQQFPGKNVI